MSYSVSSRLVSGFVRVMTFISGAALTLMMLVVVADTVGRNFNIIHILSTIEQISIYMMFLGFFGLSVCFANHGNLVVDVATSSLPESVVFRIDAVWAVCTAVILIPLGVIVFLDGFVAHNYGQRSEVLGISPLAHHAIAGFGLSTAGLLSVFVALQLFAGRSPNLAGGDGQEIGI